MSFRLKAGSERYGFCVNDGAGDGARTRFHGIPRTAEPFVGTLPDLLFHTPTAQVEVSGFGSTERRKILLRDTFRPGDGAGDGARTRYLHLGKVALYQMSYARINVQPPTYQTMLRMARQLSNCTSLLAVCANKLVPPVGIEPTTRGFSVRCSTN